MRRDAASQSRPGRGARWWRARWWMLAAAILGVGYADLWRGGLSLGPVCLVLGYGVLVPVAIWRR